MTHTPGPWVIRTTVLDGEWDPDGSGEWIPEYLYHDGIEGPNGEKVATLSDVYPNVEANAALIAAAPELLEAAEAMVELAYEYNSIRGKLVRDTPEDKLYADRIEALEAAIAKARGQ